jgi:hypothetical protein
MPLMHLHGLKLKNSDTHYNFIICLCKMHYNIN